MSAMHVAESSMPIALPRPRVAGQAVLIGLIAGVTWLALVGAWLGVWVWNSSGAAARHTESYYAYDLRAAAPTPFGTLTVTSADLTNGVDAVSVHVTLQAANTRDVQVDAPRIEDLRLVTAAGVEVGKPVPGEWSGPARLVGRSVGNIDITYTTPLNPGLLWLEYRDRSLPAPIRVILGTPAVSSLGEDA